jgi:hypothetical protein
MPSVYEQTSVEHAEIIHFGKEKKMLDEKVSKRRCRHMRNTRCRTVGARQAACTKLPARTLSEFSMRWLTARRGRAPPIPNRTRSGSKLKSQIEPCDPEKIPARPTDSRTAPPAADDGAPARPARAQFNTESRFWRTYSNPPVSPTGADAASFDRAAPVPRNRMSSCRSRERIGESESRGMPC